MDDERFLGWVILIVFILSGVGIVIERLRNLIRDTVDDRPFTVAIVVVGVLVLVLLSGCASVLFTEPGQKAIDQGHKLVDQYCERITPYDRELFRLAFNPTPAGATVEISCPQ